MRGRDGLASDNAARGVGSGEQRKRHAPPSAEAISSGPNKRRQPIVVVTPVVPAPDQAAAAEESVTLTDSLSLSADAVVKAEVVIFPW